MKVRELMASSPITCRETATLGEAAQLMWEHDIGFLPVVDDKGGLAGVITDRDGYMAAYFQGVPLSAIPVRAAMSTYVATVLPEAEVDEAELTMSDFQVHRLPVVDAGKLVGVISLNDIARKAAGEANELLEEEVALTLGSIAQPRARA